MTPTSTSNKNKILKVTPARSKKTTVAVVKVAPRAAMLDPTLESVVVKAPMVVSEPMEADREARP